MKIDQLVQKHQLQPHPEGGFYRETYRSALTIAQEALPAPFKTNFSASTAIYFLLTADNFSALHRIPQDELWHFYAGDPLEIHIIYPNGKYEVLEVGNPLDGFNPQAMVPANCWFGSRVQSGGQYSFVGCTVAPGFNFSHFEMARANTLQETFPQHRQIISELTRD